MTQEQENTVIIITKILQKYRIENLDKLEPEIEHVTSLVLQLESSVPSKSNDLLSQLELSFVVLFGKIGQPYESAVKKSKISSISNEIYDQLRMHPKFQNIKLKVTQAQNTVSLYDQVTKAFRNVTKNEDVNKFEYNLADFTLKISELDKLLYVGKASSLNKSLEESCKLLFNNFDNSSPVLDFVKNLEQNLIIKPATLNLVKKAADTWVMELETSIAESEQKLSFKEGGALAVYLESADSKTLATNLDRNMRDNHIILDKDFRLNYKVQKLFPANMIEKIQEIGKELEELQKARGTFTGKVRQKTGDYVAIVVETFTKLFGKKLDDPELEAAVKECNSKMKEIEKHLTPEQVTPRRAGGFINQLLEAQSGKGQQGPRRE